MGLYYEHPLELVSGSGSRVTDASGRTYLDFFCGILTNMLGYDVPEVRDAVQRQLSTGIVHTSTLYLIRSQVELAEKLARLSGIKDAKVFFTNSGTEANETALMLATAARRSNQVLAMRGSYHGRSFGAVAITGNLAWKSSPLAPFSVQYLHGTDRYLPAFAGLSRCRVHRGVHRRPAAPADRGDRAGRGVPDRRAGPGRRRVHHGAGRAARRVPRPAGRARRAVHLRRGADRLGPDRRALLGLPGARGDPRHDHVRQGARQRVRDRRGDRPRRPHGRPARQRHLHVRRQPAVHHRGQRGPRLRARPRPAAQRGHARHHDHRRAARGDRAAGRRRRGPRQGAHVRRGPGGPGYRRAQPGAGHPRARGGARARPAHRQGRPVRPRAADGPADEPDRGRGQGGPGPAHRRAARGGRGGGANEARHVHALDRRQAVGRRGAAARGHLRPGHRPGDRHR